RSRQNRPDSAAASAGAARVTHRQLIVVRSYYAGASRLASLVRGLARVRRPSDVRGNGGRLLAQRAPERSRQLEVVLVGHREDSALRDLARQVLQDLRQRLLRDTLRGIVHVD